jgi:hypothetical protein
MIKLNSNPETKAFEQNPDKTTEHPGLRLQTQG